MADKQAFVYIVDVGRSMGETNSGRDESDLEFGMRYVWDKIATTVAAGRKTWTLGIIALRTDATKNPFPEEEEYQNISILQPIVGSFGLSDLQKIQQEMRPSQTDSGDAISAVVVAIDMLETFTKKLKYQRKIVLVTNGRGYMKPDDIDEVVKKLNEDDIELVVIGLDFDDAEYGYKEEDKDPFKAGNEGLLRNLVAKCERSTFGTMAEAVAGIAIPSVKQSRPYKNYDGQLTLGDPDKYQTAICIDVERYFRTHKATAATASNFVVRSNLANIEATQSSHTLSNGSGAMAQDTGDDNDGGLAAIKNLRTYKVDDPDVPGTKKEVQRDDLAKGYEYGRTAVYISESDQNVTKLETTRVFSIIGFIPREKYERFFNMGPTNIVIAQKTNPKARMALSSLIHALFELDSYAIARIVLKDGKDPQLLLLAPSIEPDLECLIDVPLPFAEDVRGYRFPPLDRVITVSGTTLTQHRNIPSEALASAMSAYVDSMDLSLADKDDEGHAIEAVRIDETYSPTIHRLNQAIKSRATRPSEPVSEPAELLMRYSHPPQDLAERSSSLLANLVRVADIKKVPPRVKGKRDREAVKPLSGLPIDELLNNNKRHKINPDNAIPEFKQMLQDVDDRDVIVDAAKQMSTSVQSLITHSLGDSKYGQAIECLRVLRHELEDLEEPQLYNEAMRDLKTKLLAGSLGGDRRDFFFELRRAQIGLITTETVEYSDATKDEGQKFLSMQNEIPVREKP